MSNIFQVKDLTVDFITDIYTEPYFVNRSVTLIKNINKMDELHGVELFLGREQLLFYQEIPCPVWNHKVHDHNHKTPPTLEVTSPL